MRYTYAGIGSRETPVDSLAKMTAIAAILENKRFVLRSGGANGADQAFEDGLSLARNMDIFLPWDGFNNKSVREEGYCTGPKDDKLAMIVSEKFHPAWHKLSDTVKQIMSRNCYQVLGVSLREPADLIICWTKNGEVVGGTGQALRIAEYYGIPVLNLGKPNISVYSAEELVDFIERKLK